MQIPLIHSTDVLVFGAPSATVSAALAVHAAGRTVVAISDRPYFGEESAGALQLWPEVPSKHPLYTKLFGPDTKDGPTSPRAIKHLLETELLQAGIPFLFDVRPVFLLRDPSGTPAGVVLAARSALYAVRFRVAIDTSRSGVLARLAGLPIVHAPSSRARRLVVVGGAPPEDASFAWAPTQTPVRWPKDDTFEEMDAFTLDLRVDDVRKSFLAQASADSIDRTRLHYPGIMYSAESWIDTPTERIATHTTPLDDPLDLPDEAFLHCDGRLLLLNGLLPVTDHGAQKMIQYSTQLDLGQHVGRLAAEAVSHVHPVGDELICTNGAVGSVAAAAGWGSDLTHRAAGDLRFATGLTRPRQGDGTLQLSFDHLPVLHECDVLVAGGGTGGAPAGISAAREGARTVVLERLHGLGGVGTLGLITRYWFGNRVGFTSEIDDGVESLRPEWEKRRPGGWNPEAKMGWYLRALHESGASAWLGSFAFGVQMQGGDVAGVLVSTPYGAGIVQTGAVVDATGNADLAAAAGAPCREVGAKHVAVQGTGLSPRRPGLHYRNSDHTFIDDSDPVGITHAFVNARAKFQGEFDVAPIVGSRERRQIRGEIELSPLDYLAERTFPDTVVTAESNFDSHGFTIHPVFMVYPPDKAPLRAHVPFRCLLPQGVENMLVTGLGMSAHRDALPVVRMQPDVQNQGYAAGLAAAMAVAAGQSMRDLDIRKLQQRLVDANVLDAAVLTHQDSFPIDDEVVRAAVERGPVDLFSAAIIFAHPKVSIPLLTQQLRDATTDAQRREDAALILGLLGQDEAAETLAAIVAGRDWDEGWNFRGMGQFGPSLSRLDTLIIALGKTRSRLGVEPILQKIHALDETSAFSHCRAVSVAASALNDPRLAEALYALLQRPGMQGHAHVESVDVVTRAVEDMNENAPRNAALKELLLGRGLYLCGDWHGLGRRILETYANDLRGHFARHAQAVLACDRLEELRAEVI